MPLTNPDIKATAVVLGGTGELGYFVSTTLLTEYHHAFPTVRVTTRNPSSAKATELAKRGAEIHAFHEPLDVILNGADVVVNILSTELSLDLNKELIPSLIKNKVKVYFPSHFASDLRTLNFPGYEHSEWTGKRALMEETRTLAEDKIKVIEVATGLWLSWIARPEVGIIDLKNNKFRCAGPTTARCVTNGLVDIARAVAQLSVLALEPATSAEVPDIVRIAGQNVSIEEIRDTVSRVKGIEPGEIINEDLTAAKESLRKKFPDTALTVFDYARVAVGEGNLDFTVNDNAIVNPEESRWKWRTLEDELRELELLSAAR